MFKNLKIALKCPAFHAPQDLRIIGIFSYFRHLKP